MKSYIIKSNFFYSLCFVLLYNSRTKTEQFVKNKKISVIHCKLCKDIIMFVQVYGKPNSPVTVSVEYTGKLLKQDQTSVLSFCFIVCVNLYL